MRRIQWGGKTMDAIMDEIFDPPGPPGIIPISSLVFWPTTGDVSMSHTGYSTGLSASETTFCPRTTVGI